MLVNYDAAREKYQYERYHSNTDFKEDKNLKLSKLLIKRWTSSIMRSNKGECVLKLLLIMRYRYLDCSLLHVVTRKKLQVLRFAEPKTNTKYRRRLTKN